MQFSSTQTGKLYTFRYSEWLKEQPVALVWPATRWSSCNPGGNTPQSFIRGGSVPRSNPTFVIEKLPLLYTLHRKSYLFQIPTERLLLNVPLEKPFKILG